ncbi:MAG: DUF4113 domain-containing protein, partial [Muribaculaceae bacterium]|nr:DUF4113 domain-containing protein [Muribaculaceae bacterium]
HRTDHPQYCSSAYRPMPEPTNDTMLIATAAQEAFEAIFKEGYGYKRAGIIISDLSDDRHLQPSLFTDSDDRDRRRRLMETIDRINASSLSHDNVHIASYMPLESYVRCEHRSPNYSTRLNDIIQVSNHGL